MPAVINIGIEGLMLVSAFTSVAAGSATGSWIIGMALRRACRNDCQLRDGVLLAENERGHHRHRICRQYFRRQITVLMMSILYDSHGSYVPENPVSIPNVVVSGSNSIHREAVERS